MAPIAEQHKYRLHAASKLIVSRRHSSCAYRSWVNRVSHPPLWITLVWQLLFILDSIKFSVKFMCADMCVRPSSHVLACMKVFTDIRCILIYTYRSRVGNGWTARCVFDSFTNVIIFLVFHLLSGWMNQGYHDLFPRFFALLYLFLPWLIFLLLAMSQTLLSLLKKSNDRIPSLQVNQIYWYVWWT